MSIVRDIDEYRGHENTTLSGVVDCDCTYEIIEENRQRILILRTSSHATVHITPNIGKKLVKVIVDNLL